MRADAQANRAAILTAARGLYASRGGSVPLSAVAEEAGVGIATLYRHFPTLLDLRLGIASELLGQVHEAVEDGLTAMVDDPETGWHEFAARIAGLMLSSILPHLAEDYAPDELPAQLADVRGRLLADVDRIVVRAKEAGLVESSITTPQIQLGLAWISRPLPPFALAFVPGQQEWLVENFLRGLRP